jgi:hypothetical protein
MSQHSDFFLNTKMAHPVPASNQAVLIESCIKLQQTIRRKPPVRGQTSAFQDWRCSSLSVHLMKRRDVWLKANTSAVQYTILAWRRPTWPFVPLKRTSFWITWRQAAQYKQQYWQNFQNLDSTSVSKRDVRWKVQIKLESEYCDVDHSEKFKLLLIFLRLQNQ